MRQKYTMTDEQLKTLLDACKAAPYVVIGGVVPRSPQENANAAWQALGKELGFKWDTVQPYGNDQRCFMAEPLEAA